VATVQLSRSDLYPVGTSVGIYDAPIPGNGTGAPAASPLASGTVDAAGNLTVTSTTIPSLRGLTAYALVNGVDRYARVRSRLDVFDTGGGTGTGDTASSTTVSNAGISLPVGAGAVTAVAATDLFTQAGHPYEVGDPVRFTGLTGGAGITAGKTYYVIASGLTANDFKVSATLGGATIDVTIDLTAGTVARARAFQIGQIITGPGIPAGTTIINVVGDTLTISAAATATASQVALVAYGAAAWSAVVKRRRVAIGTL
jgi:hypothetical protein